MFDGVVDGFRHVSQNVPEILSRVETDEEDDKQSDKLDGEGAAQHCARHRQPQPPGVGKGSTTQVAKLGHGVRRARDEKQQDGIQQNVAVQRQQTNV